MVPYLGDDMYLFVVSEIKPISHDFFGIDVAMQAGETGEKQVGGWVVLPKLIINLQKI